MHSFNYSSLWCKSNRSFLEGASHPEELVEEAHRLGLHSLALTDRDGVYGVVRAHLKAKELGFHLIIGAQISIKDGSSILLLVRNRTGYRNLCHLISKGRLRYKKGTSKVSWTEVAEHQKGLFALWLNQGPVELLLEAFDNRLYGFTTRHRYYAEVPLEKNLREKAAKYNIPVVAGMEVLYHQGQRRAMQDVLTALRHGVSLPTAGSILKPNAEFALRSPTSFKKLYSDDLLSVSRTISIAEQCNFSLEEIQYQYPVENLPNNITLSDHLSKLTLEGANSRYGGNVPKKTKLQLKKELKLINDCGYGEYFLTMYEIVQYCRRNDILCQGRGSAANSAVCYSLGITAIDPVRMGLLFERFISKERAEPPDIDLDIAHQRREEVIQFVYNQYGRSHAAMIANIVRYRPRSAVRDVGKALGISEISIGNLAKLSSNSHLPTTDDLKTIGLNPLTPSHKQWLQLVRTIREFPRHLSIHPGGFLLGHEPIHQLVPIENATKARRTVIQWDKEDIAALRLFKIDLLGLGALTQLDLCFKLLKEHRDIELSIATIPPKDQKTFNMISRSETLGVFQIESRAQMAMLPRLKPNNYFDLVVSISIVRPGPIAGNMVHPYLRRRNGKEPVTYPHKLLEPVLKKTLGIPLFQEQVMRLAVVAADYTPGEADQLRRDMATWRQNGNIERHRKKLITRMSKKGVDPSFGERVFEQIAGFGEYGFPESHAASFALISYAAAFLLCHYPAEFTCALLNAQPMGFYSPATIINYGKRRGVKFFPVDIRVSDWDCTMTAQSIRMGLRYVKGLSKKNWELIRIARKDHPFKSIIDFHNRTRLNKKTLNNLAKSGAFQHFKMTRRSALWETLGVREKQFEDQLPISEPDISFKKLNAFETITWDHNTSSHSTLGHPLAPLRKELIKQKLFTAVTLANIPNGRNVRYAGIVICRQRPSNASGVTFITLEDETGFANLIIWPNKFEKYETLLKTTSFLGVSGTVQKEKSIVHLIVSELWQPKFTTHPAAIESHDFH